MRLVNIAGGPAMDSLNALLLLARERPACCARARWRSMCSTATPVARLRRARAGGAVGAGRAAARARRRRCATFVYDWNDTRPLRGVLDDARARARSTVGSSEGGLFEYGTDDAILANLTTAREAGPPDFAMLGSVTRADRPIQRLRETSQPATRPRGFEVFRALVARAGWRVERAIERPFSDQIVMTRAPETRLPRAIQIANRSLTATGVR